MDGVQPDTPDVAEGDTTDLFRIGDLLSTEIVEMIHEEGVNVEQSYRLASNIERRVKNQFRHELQDHTALHHKWAPWVTEMMSTTSSGKNGALATIPAPKAVVYLHDQDLLLVDSAMTNLAVSLG